jgi:hypothetical protein
MTYQLDRCNVVDASSHVSLAYAWTGRSNTPYITLNLAHLTKVCIHPMHRELVLPLKAPIPETLDLAKVEAFDGYSVAKDVKDTYYGIRVSEGTDAAEAYIAPILYDNSVVTLIAKAQIAGTWEKLRPYVVQLQKDFVHC